MDQAGALYEEIQKAKDIEFRFQAAINGAELKDDVGSVKEQSGCKASVPLFGDPEAYNQMSDQEKDSLTGKMMNKHKSWSGNKLKGH